MSETVINANKLSKCFKVYGNPWHRAVEWGSLGKVKKHEEFWALKDISFQVNKGECLGIIGANGAGKSTLLKILTGTLTPTSGEFSVNGNVLSLLELGTGFNAELTGRQNLFNSARLLGFPDSYIAGRIKEIEEFSELGDFFDRPIRTYSSGMHVRLAFSMFVNMEPQILIIDEALSVGDVFFQQKSFARMREIIKSGTTCIFVSHDLSAVQNLCDRAIFLSNGEIAFMGEPEATVSRYYSTVRKPIKTNSLRKIENTDLNIKADNNLISGKEVISHNVLNGAKYRFGSREMEILAACVQNKDGVYTLQTPMLEYLTFHLLLRANEHITEPSAGIRLTDRIGNVVFAAGTRNLNYQLPSLQQGDNILVRFDICFSVQPGEYSFMLGCSLPASDDLNAGFNLDRHEMLGPIVVTADNGDIPPFYGIAQIPMKVQSLFLGRKEVYT